MRNIQALMIYGIFQMVLDLIFAQKGCPLDKNLVTHSELGAFYFMIVVWLMSLSFLSHAGQFCMPTAVIHGIVAQS